MIGLVTAEARATMEKGRRKREREERARMGGDTAAHAAAEGAAAGHVMDEASPDMGKGFQGIGVSDGPDRLIMPGQVSPSDFDRAYIQAGHGAPSPSQGPPNTPHVDLRGDRGMARPLNPHAPLPVEGPLP